MAKPINMPKLSDEMTEGKLVEWLKKEGDEIEAGDVVAQVETEKAMLDVEAFEPGVLIAIRVQQGETAPVGTPIAWIGKRGERAPEAAPVGRPSAAKEAGAGGEVSQPSRQAPPMVATTGAAAGPTLAGTATPSLPPTPSAPRHDGRVVASPAARKLARERGIDLAALAGSGPGGRIILADVERGAAPAPAILRPPALERRPRLPPRRTLREETIPLSPMRRAMARGLAASKPGAPHFYLEMSADMRRMVALREQLNELGEGEVSLNDIIIKAVAEALVRHPEVNAAWAGEAIVRHGRVHLGMAVALEEGLITPVLRDADRKSVFEIARLSRELAGRAREKRLLPEEYQGATFTVSNLGMYGVEGFAAIINPPEAGILAVGAVHKVPWVDDSGELVAMERCRLTLSGDHRVIDGATGARFLQTVVAVLESPVRLVLS